MTTEYGGAFMKYCKEKQPKAPYAERAYKFLRQITSRALEDHGANFVPKWQQFVSKSNCQKISLLENLCEMSKSMNFFV